jgi:hypothetical protein
MGDDLLYELFKLRPAPAAFLLTVFFVWLLVRVFRKDGSRGASTRDDFPGRN